MGRQANIRKDIPISEIRRVKRDLHKFIELYDKVTFIMGRLSVHLWKNVEKLLKQVTNG